MNFKQWIIDLFKDERGSISIKPVLALIGALTLCTFLIANAYIKADSKFVDTIINAIMLITIVGMGGDTIDKFSYRKNQLGLKDPVKPDEEKHEDRHEDKESS